MHRSVRASYHRLPCSQDPAKAKAPAFIHHVVRCCEIKGPGKKERKKDYLMCIYDAATCVFRSIIHYKDNNSWASV